MGRFATSGLVSLMLALLVVVSVASPAAGRSGPRASSTPTIGPEGDAFYEPPDPLPLGEPGDLIWYREVPYDGPPEYEPSGTNYLVLYHSRTALGEDVAVSGTVGVPGGPAPAGGWPIESHAHPTVGIADCNAPSKFVGSDYFGTDHIDARTDYEGLGTPGEHSYLVGRALGANVLDIARAAQQLPDAHASNSVVARGFSEGGHAALFAGEMAESYAPELELAGVVASSPAVELEELLKTSARTPAALHYAAFAAWGFADTYGLDIEHVMTPAAIESVANHAACDPDPIVLPITSFTADTAFVAAPWDVPTWAPAIETNTPGRYRSVPVYVFAGGQDPVVPLPAIRNYVARACASGTPVTLFVHPQGDHAGILEGDHIDSWVADRRAGLPAEGSACDGQPPSSPPRPPGDGGGAGNGNELIGVGEAPPASPTVASPSFTG